MLVKFNKATVMDAEGVKLMPGANQVDRQAWERARKHPIVKALIEDGTIEELEEIADEHPLKNLKPGAAISLVKETVDAQLLKGWLEDEERKPVRAAIEKQIEALEEPAELRDRSMSEEEKAEAKKRGKKSKDDDDAEEVFT
jgi:hypothetical protein